MTSSTLELFIAAKNLKPFSEVTDKTSERELRILEEGEEMEVSQNELEEELAKIKSGWKCSLCNRPCSAHKGPTGPQCGMDPLKT